MTEEYKKDQQQQTARNTNTTQYGNTSTSKTVKQPVNKQKSQKSQNQQNCDVSGSCSTTKPTNKGGWN